MKWEGYKTMFWVWRMLIQFRIAKTGSWETKDPDGTRVYIFSSHIMKERKSGNKLFALIIGPFSLLIGWAKRGT